MSVAVHAGPLLSKFESALSRAQGGRIVSATVELDEIVDPTAVAAGSRLATDRWFSWEQPDRGFSLAGLGAAAEIVSRGPDRFSDLAARCSRTAHDRVAEEPPGLPAGAGAVWSTGFAFAPEGGGSSMWSSLPPALAVLPEVAMTTSDGRSFLTVCGVPTVDAGPDQLIQRIAGRLGSLRPAPLTPADPHPSTSSSISGRHPPERYEEIVATAVERIGAGDAAKVVLARELTVEAPAAIDPATKLGALRDLFPSCFCFCF